MEEFSLITNINNDYISRSEGKEKRVRVKITDTSPVDFLKSELKKYDQDRNIVSDSASKYEKLLYSLDIKVLAAAIFIYEKYKTMKLKHSEESLEDLRKEQRKEYMKSKSLSKEELNKLINKCINIISEDIGEEKMNEVNRDSLIIGIYSYFNKVKDFNE